MALPAPIAFDRLDVGDTAAIVHRLNVIRDSIGSLSAEDASDVASRAKLAQKYAAIHKAAKAVREAAYRLEVAALRRIGELGFADSCKSLRAEERRAANLFATFTEHQMDRVMAQFSWVSSATGLKRAIERGEENNRITASMQSWSEGDGPDMQPGYSNNSFEAAYSITAAIETLMAQADENQPFTVEQLADRVIQTIRPDDETTDSFMRRAVRGFVRDAISKAVETESSEMPRWTDGALADFPKVVTFNSAHLGWIRIPFLAATLAQFRWFVEMREAQAMVATTKAEKLRRLLTVVENAPHMKETTVCKRAFRMTTGEIRT